MIAAPRLDGMQQVLEVGTGYGYQTALLARIAGGVVSIEIWPDLAEQARRNLTARGIGNVVVLAADGTEGAPGRAPFDAIVVSAAFPRVPSPLAAQLRIGGTPGPAHGRGGRRTCRLVREGRGRLARVTALAEACFVRLRGRRDFPELAA
jgi:protein-L-isoaspartate(D-aspartate) O-methyltransferase